ncbi:peptide/nickel transport system permease protein [Limnobacter thiooxidans]|uniref:ABC transporter permease n=1 Tax=Limnobacter thiooxidans TaxID=131080 RepID=A0AA86M8D1_9BURK|nr:peptide/nickel transport system permease protein [Limnobacter thiooxidans]BET25679.1 ABC transporter permease [Limnobacter thiooxidans]
MMPTLLLTDALIWLLVFGLLAYARSVIKNPLSRASWGLVFQSKIASASLVVLLLAVVITLLDSVHLRLNSEQQSRYASPIISVLDVALGPLAYEREKSYSAPLATRALSKESMEVDGKPVRDYPRLKFGGVHLSDESNKAQDLLLRAYQGTLGGAVLWAFFLAALWVIRRAMAPAVAQNSIGVFTGSGAYQAVVWTLFVLCILGGVVSKWAEAYHVLGTDKVGVDVFYIALKGLRTAMLIGLLTTLLTLPVGIAMGLAAGYFRGWVDDVIQYIYTTLNSIPSVLLIAATVLMLQVALDANPDAFASSVEKADLRLFFLCAILGLTSWTGLARLIRGEVLKMREQDYILAARASGVSSVKILFSHLLPNLMHLILIAMVMDFSGLVLAEAVLSYVGVGVDPSTFSYGTMINAARLELSRDPVVWWSLVAAFVFMLLLVLSANLFADAVRDAFDPRARQLKQSLVRV